MPRFGIDDPPREQSDGAPAVDGVVWVRVPRGEFVVLSVCVDEDRVGVFGRVGGLGAFVEVICYEFPFALHAFFFGGWGSVCVEVVEGGEDERGGLWHFELADCAA